MRERAEAAAASEWAGSEEGEELRIAGVGDINRGGGVETTQLQNEIDKE